MGQSKLAEWLIEQCEIRNLSWSEASRRAMVSPNTISEAINGTRIGPHRLSHLAAFFGVTNEFVMRLAGVLATEPMPPAAVREEREVIAMLRSLSADMRALAVALLRTLATTARPAPARSEPEPGEYTTAIIGEDDDLMISQIMDEVRRVPPQRRQEALAFLAFLQRHSEPLDEGQEVAPHDQLEKVAGEWNGV